MNTPNTTIGNKVECLNQDIYKWSFTQNTDGSWFINNKANTNLVWDLSGSNRGEGVAILAYNKHGGNNQRWNIQSIGPNKYIITSRVTNKCARPGPYGHWNWQYSCNGDIIENWIIEEWQADVVLPSATFNASKWYRFKSERFNWCAYMNTPNTTIGNKDCVNSDIFKWSITQNTDGTVFITNKANNNLVWDLSGSNQGEGVAILAFARHGGRNQRWFIRRIDSNRYLVQSAVTNKCARPGPYGHWDWQYTCSNQQIDNWIIEEWEETPVLTATFNPNKWYKFRSERFNWCAYMNTPNTVTGNKVDCANSDIYKWSITQNPDGTFFITNKANSNLVWDLAGSNKAENTAILAFAKHGGDNQRWRITPVLDGSRYIVTSKVTGKCARPGPHGAWNWQFTCTNQNIDRWYIEEWADIWTPYTLTFDLNLTYLIKSKKFEWCSNNAGLGSGVSNAVCSYSPAFQWRFTRNADDGSYFIRSQSNPNLAWELLNSNNSEGASVGTNTFTGRDNQRFFIYSTNGIEFTLVNKLADKCARPGPFGHWVWSYRCTGDIIDLWLIEALPRPTTNTNINIVNKSNGNCIKSTGNNSKLRHGSCTLNDLWRIEFSNGNYFIRFGNNNGQVWDITGSGVANGVNAINYIFTGNNNQRFQVYMISDNFYHFKNVNSNKCLTIQDNGDVVQWDCSNTTDRQLFQISTPATATYQITGNLINSVTGAAFTRDQLVNGNAQVTFTNNQTGQVFNGDINYDNSSYSGRVPNGTYDVTFSLDGYVTLTYQITVNETNITTNITKDLVISSVVRGLRVVLTWGATPKDIDLYVQDPAGNRIYWNNKAVGPVKLDVDDRNANGPETITIDESAKGIHKIYVRNYSKEDKLGNSKGVVTLNIGESQAESIEIPSADHPADQFVWNVAEYDATDGQIKVINTIQVANP